MMIVQLCLHSQNTHKKCFVVVWGVAARETLTVLQPSMTQITFVAAVSQAVQAGLLVSLVQTLLLFAEHPLMAAVAEMTLVEV